MELKKQFSLTARALKSGFMLWVHHAAAKKTNAYQLVALAFLCGGCLAAVAQLHDWPVSTHATQVIHLDYKELDSPVLSVNFHLTEVPSPFKKEPDTGGRKVERCRVIFGGDASSLSLLWDYKVGRLYLDLQHDGDLTKASSSFVCDKKAHSESSQDFKGIRLKFKSATNSIAALVDFHFDRYDAPNHFVSVSVQLRSFWDGKVRLQGRDFHLGLAGYPPPALNEWHGRCQMLLRPWEKRGESINMEDGSLAGFAFKSNIFYQNQAFQVCCVPAESNNCLVELSEEPVALQEVAITGKYIQRLILSDRQERPMTVVLDTPEPTVRIPVGTYRSKGIFLKNGEAEACAPAEAWKPLAPVTITAANRAVLTGGGPLTNLITVTNRRGVFVSDYQLLGSGGEEYRLNPKRRSPAKVLVFQNDKQIASGSFEFG